MELNDALRKVRGLVAKAESLEAVNPDDPEAKVARKMADGIMFKWRIDQALLDETQPEELRSKPDVIRGLEIAVRGNPARGWLLYLADRVAQHCRCQIIYFGVKNSRIALKGDVHGFESDLRYFEIVWTAVYLHMASVISPKWDESKSEESNIVALHEKGLNWLDIARINPVQPGGKWNGNQSTAEKYGSRVKRIYFAWCKANDKPRVSTGNRIQYIRNFSEGYYRTLNRRFTEIERERDRGSGTDLVLASDQDRLKEAIAMMYGDLQSLSSIGGLQTRYNGQAYEAGSRAGNEVDISGRGRTGSAERTAIQ